MMILASLVLILYVLLLLWLDLKWKETTVIKSNKSVFVSVIVAVRNEEKNIPLLLDNLYAQQYPKDCFEVIIVNDHSEDRTAELVQLFIEKHHDFNLSLINLEKEKQKKAAIRKGVLVAKGDLIITTDADCRMSSEWLQAISSYYSSFKPQMIVAPVRLEGGDSFFQQFQQMDYLALQVAGLSSVHAGFPLACSGANLAFQKKCFQEINGYEGNENIASGDDVFLMLRIHALQNGSVHALVSKEAIVSSISVKTVSDFFQQRLRWGSKVKHYPAGYIKVFGALVFLTNILIMFTVVNAFFNPSLVAGLIILLAVKLLADLFFLMKGARFFTINIYKLSFLFAGLIYPFYYVVLFLASLAGKYEWKGRKGIIKDQP